MIVKNETPHVAVVENSHFRREIASGDTVHITDAQIGGDLQLSMYYFSYRKEKKHSEVKAERGLRGMDVWLETESILPQRLQVCAEGLDRITLRDRTPTFMFFYLKVRLTHLKRVDVWAKGKRRGGSYRFFSPKEKRLFIRRMAIEGGVTLALSLALLIPLILDFREPLVPLLIGGGLLLSAIRKLVYLFFALRQGADKETGE